MTCPVSTTPRRTDDELRCIAELTFFGITEVRFFFGLISFLFLFYISLYFSQDNN